MAAISIKDFVKITFETGQDSSITAAQTGVVCLLLQDSAEHVGTYYVKNSKQIPSGLNTINRDAIKLALKARPAQIIVAIREGTASAVDLKDSKVLESIEGLKFNYLAVPNIDPANAKIVADWAKAYNEANPMYRFITVVPNYEANSPYVINFAQDKVTIDKTELTTTQATAYVAAKISAVVPAQSMTYQESEASACNAMSLSEIDAAGVAGKLVMLNDDRVIRFANDANSLTSLSDKQDETYQDIRCVEIMNLFFNSVKTSIYRKYINKYSNNYTNKLLLVGEINKLLKNFEASGLVEHGDSDVALDLDAQRAYLTSVNYTTKDGKGVDEMSEDEIKRADTKKHVFLKVRMKPLAAIEAVEIVVRT